MKEGWKYVRLGDVATYINGFAFKPDDWSSNGIPIIRIQNLTDSSRAFNYCSREDVPLKFYVDDGDILISWSATLGVFEWCNGKALLNQHIFKVVFNKMEINKQYFKYAIYMSIDEMSKHTNGATMKHIRKGDFDNIRIPLPPLPEQERIVSLLDAEFAKIDAIKANAEKQLQDAKALFQSALKDYLTPKEGWEEKTLKEITSKIGSGATPKGGRKVYIKEGCSLIRSMNVHYGFFKYDDLAHINDEAARQLNGVEIYEDDVLFNITGASIARCCVVPNNILPARVNQHVSILRTRKEMVLPSFLSYMLISPIHQKELLQIGEAGSTRQALTKTNLEEHIVTIPLIEEQHRIMEKIEQFSAKIKSLQSNFDTTVTLCNDLKQSILKDIFG
jgi:type I restriction enzyme S subunit